MSRRDLKGQMTATTGNNGWHNLSVGHSSLEAFKGVGRGDGYVSSNEELGPLTSATVLGLRQSGMEGASQRREG